MKTKFFEMIDDESVFEGTPILRVEFACAHPNWGGSIGDWPEDVELDLLPRPDFSEDAISAYLGGFFGQAVNVQFDFIDGAEVTNYRWGGSTSSCINGKLVDTGTWIVNLKTRPLDHDTERVLRFIDTCIGMSETETAKQYGLDSDWPEKPGIDQLRLIGELYLRYVDRSNVVLTRPPLVVPGEEVLFMLAGVG
jgi:hypothetical protein